MEISERIRRWREAAGLDQFELAEAMGLTRAAVYQWETGSTTPTIVSLEKLVEVLGITMERFYGRAPRRKAS
jgi:transcriptional regulator with XRE-family HTH domain